MLRMQMQKTFSQRISPSTCCHHWITKSATERNDIGNNVRLRYGNLMFGWNRFLPRPWFAEGVCGAGALARRFDLGFETRPQTSSKMKISKAKINP